MQRRSCGTSPWRTTWRTRCFRGRTPARRGTPATSNATATSMPPPSAASPACKPSSASPASLSKLSTRELAHQTTVIQMPGISPPTHVTLLLRYVQRFLLDGHGGALPHPAHATLRLSFSVRPSPTPAYSDLLYIHFSLHPFRM